MLCSVAVIDASKKYHVDRATEPFLCDRYLSHPKTNRESGHTFSCFVTCEIQALRISIYPPKFIKVFQESS